MKRSVETTAWRLLWFDSRIHALARTAVRERPRGAIGPGKRGASSENAGDCQISVANAQRAWSILPMHGHSGLD